VDDAVAHLRGDECSNSDVRHPPLHRRKYGCTRACRSTDTLMYMPMHTHTHTHTYRHRHRHTHTHTHANAHEHTHTHAQYTMRTISPEALRR
jgi:hypothetical protein